MSRVGTKRARLVLLLASCVAACSDDDANGNRADGGDAGHVPDANKDAGSDATLGRDIDAANDGGVVGSDAAVNDAASQALAACLDQPGFPRPPTAELPCELLPPGLTLTR